MSAADLLKAVGLHSGGSVIWRSRIPCDAPGVYVVSTPQPLAEAPIDTAQVRAWIDRVATMAVDGKPATSEAVESRLREFWIPDESIVYIGLAGTSVASRVSGFYRTPLGNRAPHSGGHWLKTLHGLDTFLVTWAETEAPSQIEDALLNAFDKRVPKVIAARLPAGPILPFGNLETGSKVRKRHGISGSRLRRAAPTSPRRVQPRDGSGGRTSNRTTSQIGGINAAIQAFACKQPDRRVSAVEAASELDRQGLLRDSSGSPGLPLRNLLRAGKIGGAYQEGGRFWFIDCTPSNADPGPDSRP